MKALSWLSAIIIVTSMHSMSARAIPITDTITVDSREWAQVDLFLLLTWNEMNAVCPGGPCGSSTLNGYDMADWTWATVADVNALFNFYIGSNELGLGPREYHEVDSAWAPAFFNDGWNPTTVAANALAITGLLSQLDVGSGQATYGWLVDHYTEGWEDSIFTNRTTPTGQPNTTGGFFFRDASTVPIPSTLILIAIGIVALVRGTQQGRS